MVGSRFLNCQVLAWMQQNYHVQYPAVWVTKVSKRVLVTGASHGLGRALTFALVQHGHRVVMAARGYCSSSELPVTFGLGAEKTADTLQITWPNGKMQAVKVDQVDQMLKVEQE